MITNHRTKGYVTMIATGNNIIAIIESNMDEMTQLEQEICPLFHAIGSC